MGIYKLYWPAIILRDADIIKDVLIKEFGKFHDNAIDVDENVSSIFAKNPFVLNGERWKWVRSKLTPCFTSGKVFHFYLKTINHSYRKHFLSLDVAKLY